MLVIEREIDWNFETRSVTEGGSLEEIWSRVVVVEDEHQLLDGRVEAAGMLIHRWRKAGVRMMRMRKLGNEVEQHTKNAPLACFL